MIDAQLKFKVVLGRQLGSHRPKWVRHLAQVRSAGVSFVGHVSPGQVCIIITLRRNRVAYGGASTRSRGKLPRRRTEEFSRDAIEFSHGIQRPATAGFALYCNRPDKEWSLTDCISFVVMGEHGVTEALTPDGDFEQAGFRALLV